MMFVSSFCCCLPPKNNNICRVSDIHEKLSKQMGMIRQFVVVGRGMIHPYKREVWDEMKWAAEEAYDRSEDSSFTSFIGYEVTSTPTLIINGKKHPNMNYSDLKAVLDAEL